MLPETSAKRARPVEHVPHRGNGSGKLARARGSGLWARQQRDVLTRTREEGAGGGPRTRPSLYLSVSDLARSEAFYDPVMQLLGFRKGDKAIGGDPHAHDFNRTLQLSLRPARAQSPHDPYAPGLHPLCLQLPTAADVDENRSAAARTRRCRQRGSPLARVQPGLLRNLLQRPRRHPPRARLPHPLPGTHGSSTGTSCGPFSTRGSNSGSGRAIPAECALPRGRSRSGRSRHATRSCERGCRATAPRAGQSDSSTRSTGSQTSVPPGAAYPCNRLLEGGPPEVVEAGARDAAEKVAQGAEF
jgi:hypothetical protein